MEIESAYLLVGCLSSYSLFLSLCVICHFFFFTVFLCYTMINSFSFSQSSGSGSESGTQTQKSIKSKSSEKSENNSGSNDGEDNGRYGLNVGKGSEDGSGTQVLPFGFPRNKSTLCRICRLAYCHSFTCRRSHDNNNLENKLGLLFHSYLNH